MMMRGNKHQSLRERFEANYIPEPNSGCFLWTASVHVRTGYGKIGLNKHSILAHRAAWMLYRGEIPEGLCVLHRCDVRSCVRPEHLFLGTRASNFQDMVAKGRYRNPKQMRTVCPQGHPYSGKNKTGGRICRICTRKQGLAWYYRNKGKSA